MPGQGPLPGGTFASDTSHGTVAWLNPGFAVTEDAAVATAGLGGPGVTSYYLKVTNFGFTIPSGAIIQGISARIVRKASSSATSISDSRVRIVKGGTIGATDRAAAGNWPTTLTAQLYGSSSDLWGESWTDADINATTFGIVISAVASSPDTANIDFISLEVTYTVITATLSGTAIEVVSSNVLRESQVVAGGKTVIITLSGTTWVAAGATFDAQRQPIINGLDSAQSAATGWDAEVKAKLPVTAVVRTSNTVATVTLTAQALYNISVMETITCIVPFAATVDATSNVTATPTFRVVPDVPTGLHLGGLRVGRKTPPRTLATARRAIVPMGWGKIRPR